MIAVLFAMHGCGGGGGGESAPPPPQTPAVSTSAAVPGNENATLTGTVNPRGLQTFAWFEYGTDPNLANPSSTINNKYNVGDNTVTIGVSTLVTGLEIWKDYYFRVVAENAAGQPVKGSINPFKTVAPTPGATTGIADNLASIGTVASARINGSVDPKGLATTPVFEWGTTQDLSGAFTIPLAAKTGKGNQAISADLTSLSLDTDYYFRVVATNTANVVSQGKTVKFRTLPNPLPIANAGADQTVGPTPNSGALVVTLNGSQSTDVAGGTITQYNWVQTGSPPAPAVTISPSDTQIATFVAPTTVPYPHLDLNFQLTVTSNRTGTGAPFTNTDTTKVTVKWGFLDDFSTETTIPGPGLPPPNNCVTSNYVTNGGYRVQGYYGGSPCPGDTSIPDQMGYDDVGQNAIAEMSNNHGVKISHDLPASSQGVFSMDFTPIRFWLEGGGFAIYLAQDSSNFYVVQAWTDDGVNIPVIEKWAGGIKVASLNLNKFIIEGIPHSLKVTFTPTQSRWEWFDGFDTTTITLTDTSQRVITVDSVDMDFFQQNTALDNIRLEPLP
jgi:hypothetical protein